MQRQMIPGAMDDPAAGNTPVANEDGIPVAMTDEEMVRRMEELLTKYKAGKQALERRIVDNERWYRQRHAEHYASGNPGDPEPSSAWLFNMLANKHADAIDNLPSMAVLPREQSDKETAEILSDVLPVVLERNDFEQAYSDMWWYKLRSGTGLTGVFWDTDRENGLGDIAVRSLDLLNLFWEPGITDLQRSANVFFVTLHDGEQLRRQYPELADTDEGKAALGGASSISLAEYVHDESVDTSGKLMMVDWYYKVTSPDGRTLLHYAKICAGKVLFASEREPEYANGYYEHGDYPFVLDTLFPVPDSPAGFGYIDVCKSAQLYIDKLDAALLKNTIAGARPRFFVRDDGKIKPEDYADMSKDFIPFKGSGNPADSIFQVPVTEINTQAVNMRAEKINELKEVSGNRDFAQGGTSGGVTAFSAIQALKEAGSKLSRDMIASAYRAYSKIGYLCIELMRQFYTEPRTFRITGTRGEQQFAAFDGRSIGAQVTNDGFMLSERIPVFDIRVIAQRSDPFNTAVQNERAQALYQMGFFNPQMAEQALMTLDMMDFEGIDRVKAKISEQAMMQKQLAQMQQLMMVMAQELDAATGSNYIPQIQMMMQQGGGMA